MEPLLEVQAEQKTRKGFLPSWQRLSPHIAPPQETGQGPGLADVRAVGLRSPGGRPAPFVSVPLEFSLPHAAGTWPGT